jgi:hypothetical protein
MYSRFAIQTRLSLFDAECALERLVAVERDESPIKPFIGRVEKRTFKFRRVISYRNSFIPIISGQIIQGEGGAVLRGAMRLHFFAAAFMAFWIGMFVGPAVSEVSRALREHHVSSALDVVFVPLFGIALTVFGYYPERRKAMRLLTDAFQSK